MKQGSILSPCLFNYFIDDLLISLKNVNTGIRISDFHLNSIAYADDVNMVSSTCTGLQRLINVCYDYASRWRFKFGINKSKCVSIGDNNFKTKPTWFLGPNEI